MNYRILSIALVVAGLLFNSSMSVALDNKADVEHSIADSAKVSQQAAKVEPVVKTKAATKAKLVDINSASKSELMKLPGVSAAAADKIIASRPFGSKMWLVSDKILDQMTFQAIRKNVTCVITKKDFDTLVAKDKAQSKKNKKQ
jgi:DNA uptake protein ComE-like DNA-binding protein